MSEIIVSYSHENNDWVAALALCKQPDSTEEAIIWIDGNAIHGGDDWTAKFASAVERATTAILLVSPQFIKSDAIVEHELPRISQRYRDDQLRLVLVPIGKMDTAKLSKALNIPDVGKIVSIPAWDNPLPEHPKDQQAYQDVREQIVAAATEPMEVQNLRRNMVRKYKLGQKIGEGPIGYVIRARDKELDRDIAVKLLREPCHNALFKKSVRRVAAVTDHSNILTVYGAYLDAEPPHYVRQYVEGPSLRNMLDRKQEPLNIEHVQKLLSDIGAAIEHAHRQGVYGLNIKPSNVIIQEPDAPSATRFFLSLNSYEGELFEDEGRRDAIGSDIVYLPLEYRRKAGIRAIDAKQADQYRLGVVAYEMLVGSQCFAALASPLKRKNFDPSKPLWPPVVKKRPDCLEYVSGTVDRMVKAEPNERYRSVGDAVKRLEGVELEVEIVRDSYRRLMQTQKGQDDFFKAFYIQFQGRFEPAKPFFKKFGRLSERSSPSRAWKRQFQVLKEAVMLLVVYKALGEDERRPNILTRIAEHHVNMGIPAELYRPFKAVLVDTVLKKDCDHDFSEEVLRHAWEEVVTPGIEYMNNFKADRELDGSINRT